MRRRLAGFVRTLRDAGFAVGQARDGRCGAGDRKPARRPARALAGGAESAVRVRAARRRALRRIVRGFLARRAASSARTAVHGARRREGRRPPLRGAALAERRADGLARARGSRSGAGSASAPRATRPRARRVGARIARSEGLRPDRRRSRNAPRRSRSPNGSPRAMRARADAARARSRRKAGGSICAPRMRRSVARGGEPIDLKFRRRKRKPLRLVALLDASGSMELYVAVFTRFLHAVVAGVSRSPKLSSSIRGLRMCPRR